MAQFNLVVSGGTFEYLHEGHRAFLRFALFKSKKVLLGLTSDLYVQKNKKETLLSFSERKKTIEGFLRQEKALDRVSILPIDSLYIPSTWENLPINAIVVTQDSKNGAFEINKFRQKRGLSKLRIILCPIIVEKDKNPFSSTRIRESLFSHTLILPDDVRGKLKRPLGILISDFDLWIEKNRKTFNSKLIITVGDVVTKACNELLIKNQISIIDFHVGREKKYSHIKELGFKGHEKILNVSNKAGTLTPKLFKIVKKILNVDSSSRIIILVDGEEDLAVLPCMFFAPNGSMIFYGQPNEGVVLVHVSEESRKESLALLKRFDS